MDREEALMILDTVFPKKNLTNIQEQVFCQVLQGQTYEQIAETLDYSVDYIKRVGSGLWKLLSDVCEEKITKSNCRVLLRRKLQQIQSEYYSRQDWGKMIDISFFYGREEEFFILEQWIVKKQCRLVAIFFLRGKKLIFLQL